MYGYKGGDMKMHVDYYDKPESAYSQKHDQSTLNYISRQDYTQNKAASKLKSEAFKGRYQG